MKNLFIIITFTLSLLAPVLCRAQERAAKPGPATERVDVLFAQWNKPDSPGCALAVIKGGQVIYKRGYGSANLDYGIPISSQSVFNIASTSKQFTAASIALLAMQGKISLDEDIRKYLPEMPPYTTPVTVRQLIYHTSGIREYSHLMQLAGIRFQDASDEEVFKMIARQKELNFKPGDEYLYSNSGYFLLAQIVKRVSGKALREFAEENIFKPLGMINTRFHDDNTEVIKNRATGYSSRKDAGFSVERPVSNHIGDGGLLTTIDDLVLWGRNFYGNKLSGGQEFINLLLTPGTLNNGGKLNYVFGLDVEQYKGLKLFGHGGAYYGFNSDMIRFPDERFSVICLCNLSNIESGRLTRQVADIYLADVFKKGEAVGAAPPPEAKVISVPEEELSAVAGSYFNATSNNFRRLYIKGGKLIYSRGSSESELVPLGNDRFLMLGVPDRVEISFKAARPDAPLQMFTSANGGKPIVHERVEPASYTSEQMAQFAGTYYSEEIDATYTISLQGDKLVLRRKNVDDAPLQLLFADTFSSVGSGALSFTRDKQNHISGFLVNTGRVRNLRFNRM
ncbi:MAG TPA: serine hydrolase domain-containing protein [Blastocatellia bacterium]|nr:serine hydrolase domain-containing protein [Blastocatellia bacterium]